MASSMMNGSNCSLMIFLIVGAAILTVDLGAAVHISPSLKCGKSLTKECGDTIARRVVSNRGPPPTDECCISLLKIGKPCHDAFTEAHIKARDYKGKTFPVVKRSNELWRQCVEVAKFISGSAGAPKSS